MSTTIYSQVLIHTAEWTEATQSEGQRKGNLDIVSCRNSHSRQPTHPSPPARCLSSSDREMGIAWRDAVAGTIRGIQTPCPGRVCSHDVCPPESDWQPRHVTGLVAAEALQTQPHVNWEIKQLAPEAR